jgi:hypothetical protein
MPSKIHLSQSSQNDLPFCVLRKVQTHFYLSNAVPQFRTIVPERSHKFCSTHPFQVKTMKEKTIKYTLCAFIIVLVAFTAVSVWFFYPKPVAVAAPFSDDFENGLTHWTTGSDVPNNGSGQPVNWNITTSTNQSVSGSHSVLFTIDGLQDDGTTWIQHKLNLQANTQKTVNVTFQLWSPSESFNTIAVVVGYAGAKMPQSEGDFQVLGAANQVEGWKNYSFTADVTADEAGVAYVALGISVRWETNMNYFVDEVNVVLA